MLLTRISIFFLISLIGLNLYNILSSSVALASYAENQMLFLVLVPSIFLLTSIYANTRINWYTDIALSKWVFYFCMYGIFALAILWDFRMLLNYSPGYGEGLVVLTPFLLILKWFYQYILRKDKDLILVRKIYYLWICLVAVLIGVLNLTLPLLSNNWFIDFAGISGGENHFGLGIALATYAAFVILVDLLLIVVYLAILAFRLKTKLTKK